MRCITTSGRQSRRLVGHGASRKRVGRRARVSSALPRIAAGEPKPEMEVSFGAIRAGALFERLRLHMETDRFLAARREDRLWEVGCDYGMLALARVASRMSPELAHAKLTCLLRSGSRLFHWQPRLRTEIAPASVEPATAVGLATKAAR